MTNHLTWRLFRS